MHRKLPPTFPLRLILAVSFVLCLCGTGTIILAVLSVKHQTLGYNWGTGFWCGAITLASGVCGIVASHARDICSMKTFMIFAIFGGVISLVMLALSAGGLDTESGMYVDTKKLDHHMTLVVHAGCLGISLLQLVLFILADGVCIYHLFVEKSSTLFSLKTTPGNKPVPVPHRKHPRQRNTSDGSTAPIYRKPKSKHKNKKKKYKNTTQSENMDDLEAPLRENRTSALTQSRLEALPNSSPVRIHSERNSFTTFGHNSLTEQESLIVHPDEDVTTVRSESRASTRDENHYAQAMLFDPPIPIEEDDELPPYEAVDSNPYRVSAVTNTSSETGNGTCRNRNSPVRRENKVILTNELPRGVAHAGNTRGRINTRNEIPHGRGETSSTQKPDTAIVNASSGVEPLYAVVQPRRSRSADLLSEETDSNVTNRLSQGVVFKDFARSSDRMSPRSQRSQSLRMPRPNREKRLERRNRALSAEIKLSKDQMLASGEQTAFMKRTSSIDSSNSGLYADNRVMPTKFSLRTPVRQVGAPYVPSVVPVQSISSLPLFSPPPKPPRTHSVTAEDLASDVGDNAEEKVASDITDCVFIDETLPDQSEKFTVTSGQEETFKKVIQGETVFNTEEKGIDKREQNTESNEGTKQIKETETQIYAFKNKEEKTSKVNSEMKVNNGPVIKCLAKPPLATLIADGISKDDSRAEHERTSSRIDSDRQPSMKILSSPILKKSINLGDETKEGGKRETPIPKVRSSIKLKSGINKSNEAESKLKEEMTNPTFVEKNGETEASAKQRQLNKEDFSVLRVDLPPLRNLSSPGSTSPSLTILNRKYTKKESNDLDKKSHEITDTISEKISVAVGKSPTVTVSRSQSVEYKGARPKINPRSAYSVKEKSNPPAILNKSHIKTDASPFVKKNDRVVGEEVTTDPSVRPQKNKSVPKKQLVRKSLANAKAADNGAHVPLSSVRNSSNLHSTSSGHILNPVSPVSSSRGASLSAGASGYSQGVLHLPQAQFSRHMSPMETQSPGTNSASNNVPVDAQNPQNTNTSDLIISKFL